MNRRPAPSSSEETTANSGPNNGFICTVCFKVFPAGQALGGHQNAHALERSLRQTTPNILGAVLNHPLPQDDIHTLASNLARSSSGHLHQRPPVPVLQQQQPEPGRLNAQDYGYRTWRGGYGGDADYHHHSFEGRIRHATPHYHSYEMRAPSSAEGCSDLAEESYRWKQTRNLLADWSQLNYEVKGVRTMADPNADLELELTLTQKEYIDLNLKLGF